MGNENYLNALANKPALPPEVLIEQYAQHIITEKELYNMLSITELKKFRTLINAAADKRESVVVHTRDTEVLWITGKSGSGKTNTLAKWIAKQKGYDYSVASTGEHFVESYHGERCFIVDDFRGQMRFNELLNFLDNMLNVNMAARYHNKDFADCKLIIITSIMPPSKIYKSEEIMDEPIQQLYRRLGFRDSNGVAKGNYLKIGSLINVWNDEYQATEQQFSDEISRNIPDNYVAVLNCYNDEVDYNYKFISMKEPYEATKVQVEHLDTAQKLGF